MTSKEAIAALESAGSEQARKTYARHGVKPPMFGTSYAHLEKLRKAICVDQKLAKGLWETGIHDARILATMIADPDLMGRNELDLWVACCDNYVVTDAVAKVAARAPIALSCFTSWIDSKPEWTSAAGWTVLGGMLAHDPARLESKILETMLDRIERTIHDQPNRTRHSMNGALIAIGCVGAALEKKAIAAAKRIGDLDVDHGETNCRTPDAETYIPKARAYAAARAAKLKPKARGGQPTSKPPATRAKAGGAAKKAGNRTARQRP